MKYSQVFIVVITLVTCTAEARTEYEPWYTGPLIAETAKVVAPKKRDFWFRTYETRNHGIFNTDWQFKNTANSTNKNTLYKPSLKYGLFDRFEVKGVFPYQTKNNQGVTQSNIGDMGLAVDYQLLRPSDYQNAPFILLSYQETFPTGGYDHLDPKLNGTDSTGMGSLQSVFGIYSEREYHFNLFAQPVNINTRFNVTYTYPASVDIAGLSTYGGSTATFGRIKPGNTLTVDLSTELSLTQHWVAVMEGWFQFQKASSFHGIINPELPDGEGYTFNFALESNVRGNEPAEDQTNIPSPAPKAIRSLLCNENQRSTEPIRTLIVDSYTKEPVEAVQLAFSIPEEDTCVMGVTDTSGTLEESYPAVYGGTISLIKQDYLTDFYPIDTYKRKDNPSIFGYAAEGLSEPVLEINRIVSKNISIKKKMLGKCIGGDECYFASLFESGSDEAVDKYKPELLGTTHYWIYTGATQDLSQGEKAILTLKRIKGLNDKVSSQEFTAVATLDGGQMHTEADLVPGVYEVTGFITSSNPVIIPKEERCSEGVLESISCFDSDGCCFTLDEQKAEQFVLGQLDWTKDPQYLTITPDNLYGSTEIEFYIPYMDIYSVPEKAHKRVVEDFAAVGRLTNISRDLRAQLEPSYK